MATFKVLWASANLYPLISKQTKVYHRTFIYILKHVIFLICQIQVYYGVGEDGRLVFHLCVASCSAITDICYLFHPFQHVATADFHIPLPGLGFQAAQACQLVILTKTTRLEI